MTAEVAYGVNEDGLLIKFRIQVQVANLKKKYTSQCLWRGVWEVSTELSVSDIF